MLEKYGFSELSKIIIIGRVGVNQSEKWREQWILQKQLYFNFSLILIYPLWIIIAIITIIQINQ